MSVSAHSAGAYSATLYMMVNIVKGGGRASPTLTSLGLFFHRDEMYAKNRQSPLCVYSVARTISVSTLFFSGFPMSLKGQ